MPNARILIPLALAAAALAGCGKSNDQANDEQNMGLEGAMPGGVPANADVETLPADESSATPSNELQNGFVAAPDANETDQSNEQ